MTNIISNIVFAVMRQKNNIVLNMVMNVFYAYMIKVKEYYDK